MSQNTAMPLKKIPINPHLVKALPAIRSGLSRAVIVARPALTEGGEQLGALRDFLSFEIEKASLTVAQDEIDGETSAYRPFLDRMVRLQETYSPETIRASIDLIGRLLDEMEALFEDGASG